MRRILRVLGPLLLTACVTSMVAGPASADDLNSNRFRLRERVIDERVHDVGRQGPSIGDTDTFRGGLFHNGNRVGVGQGSCTITRARRNSEGDVFRIVFFCSEVLTLKGRGDLIIQGKFILDFRPKRQPINLLAITGGTGTFSGATGSVRAETQGSTLLRVHLTG